MHVFCLYIFGKLFKTIIIESMENYTYTPDKKKVFKQYCTYLNCKPHLLFGVRHLLGDRQHRVRVRDAQLDRTNEIVSK